MVGKLCQRATSLVLNCRKVIASEARNEISTFTEVNKRLNDEASRSNWGLSSSGRAPALQAGGERFESVSLHHSLGVVE